MTFKRVWDESCPHIWDQWEADGVKYTIQDLPPEDDAEALRILLEHLAPDEVLCKASGLVDDPASLRGIGKVWEECIAERMTLACYAEKDGRRQLVAANVCMVKDKGDQIEYPSEGKKWKNVLDAMVYSENNAKPMDKLGLDRLLIAMGLVVIREYRGAKLGAKVLAAREPLCRSLGIRGTTTIFTGIASQKAAARCGFYSIYDVPIKEYAQIGLDYSPDDERIVKIMVRKYD